ncbi:hypothetical protein L1049_021898 [Liquidambar formosana]|uniref:Uncharacterized protein n=1 Tax=Liquidambar formosana TaxID=63359 RepID=A0AAP0RBL7_LIQFO
MLIFYLKSFADKGGAQLYVPPGRWLTGSFNLTSHLKLFLEKGAIILGSQVLILNSIFDPFIYFNAFFPGWGMNVLDNTFLAVFTKLKFHGGVVGALDHIINSIPPLLGLEIINPSGSEFFAFLYYLQMLGAAVM